MGKRELLLAAAFIIFGVVVYQVTAPAADPSRPGWSVAGIIEHMRREVRGNRAQATTTNQSVIPVAESVRELQIEVRTGAVEVVGEVRSDIEASLKVISNAYDDSEAERTAKATRLKVDEAGAVLMLAIDYPRPGRQRAHLTLKIPRGLAVRVDEKGSSLKVEKVASVFIGSGRGETVINAIPGSVQITQRGNTAKITDVGSLKLTTFSGAEISVSRVHGDATFMLQGGELRADEIRGAIEVEARNSDVKLERLQGNRKPIRINANRGELLLQGVETDTRIDGRETDIRVDQTAASPLSIYNDGDETVEVTLPPAGFKIDARTVEGRLNLDGPLEKAGLKVATSSGPGGERGEVREEHRVAGIVRGGGPMITIRASHGDIVLRSR